MPVSAAQSEFVAELYNATGTNPVVEFDLGAVKSFDTIVIEGHNLTSGAAVTVRWGESENTTAYSAVLEWREFGIHTILSATTDWRYLRLNFADTNNPDGSVSIGQFWIGSSRESPMQFTPEWADAERFINRRQRSDIGVLHSERLVRQHDISLLFGGLSHAQATTIWSGIVVDTDGGADPIFIVPKPSEEPDRAFVVRLVEHARRRTQHFQEITLRLLEDIRGVIVG